MLSSPSCSLRSPVPLAHVLALDNSKATWASFLQHTEVEDRPGHSSILLFRSYARSSARAANFQHDAGELEKSSEMVDGRRRLGSSKVRSRRTGRGFERETLGSNVNERIRRAEVNSDCNG